jgi:hypothetical protein
MRISIAIGVLAIAGCGARVDSPGTADASESGDGNPNQADARVDAPGTPDAAPCTGGNANTVDQGMCYEAFLALPLPWTEAQAVCAGRGGALARIDSLTENALVAGLVGANRAWIGASDLAAEASFAWSDGSPLAGGFTHWRTGEPNNGNGNFEEDCAVIEGQNMDPTWDDRPCANDPLAGVTGQYFYVCER